MTIERRDTRYDKTDLRFWILTQTVCALAGAAEYPRLELENGEIQVSIYLPDAERGYYRGTRFEWSGIIERAACPEPFIRIYLGPGQVQDWSSHYRFSVEPG